MITYDNKQWIKFVMFSKGAVIGKIYPYIILLSTFTTGIYIMQFQYAWLGYDKPIIHIKIPLAFHSLLGIVLGLLLVFRTNTAYDRWWEGRKIWGAVLNTSRNFARQINAFVPDSYKNEKETLIKLCVAFSYTLKEHLRNGVKWEEIDFLPVSVLEKLKTANHVPNAVVTMMTRMLHDLYEKKHIRGAKLRMLNADIQAFVDYLGMCERIKKTPMPIAYSLHLKRFILIYLSTLPFGLIYELSWGAIPAVAVLAYTMVGIEIIGEEIEDPFGLDDNDLATDEICTSIHLNTFEILAIETAVVQKNKKKLSMLDNFLPEMNVVSNTQKILKRFVKPDKKNNSEEN
jgi:putative membrane protein